MADINLIPQSEKKEQAKERAVKSSTVVTIVLFVVVSLIGGYFYYQTYSIKNTISEHNSNIESLRNDITGLSEIEIVARNLGQRYETLKGILDNRNQYSVLMSEFEKRIPDTVVIETMGLGRDSTINVSGTGADYISIARFINNLSLSDFDGAAEGLGGLFTNVSLNSVNLDAQTNKARFFIVVTIDESLLR